MTAGARITDAVAHFRNRGNFKSAVRLLRNRSPERLRWRAAVTALASDAGRMTGGERMRVEEPIRELVLELDDALLQRELVLDARLHRVDLDRGEVLPRWSFGDLCRLSCVARADLQSLRRYVKLPTEFEAAIDTAAVVLAGRAFSAMLHQRAQRLWLSVPDEDGPEPLMMHHRYIIERANRDAETGKRWGALAKALLVQPTV
jgi:hypothetical protein